MAYCSTTDVYNVTNLTTSEIGTAEVSTLIDEATIELNSAIGITRYDDLDKSTVGSINSSNTTFHFRDGPIGDLDNDGAVGTTDIKLWYKESGDDHWTSVSNPISSIDEAEMGRFTLNTAPEEDNNYLVKWRIFPIPADDDKIKKACTELSSYMSFLKINLRDVMSFKIGKVSVTTTTRHPGLVSFYDRYKQTLRGIRSSMMFTTSKWDMSDNIMKDMADSSRGSGLPNTSISEL